MNGHTENSATHPDIYGMGMHLRLADQWHMILIKYLLISIALSLFGSALFGILIRKITVSSPNDCSGCAAVSSPNDCSGCAAVSSPNDGGGSGAASPEISTTVDRDGSGNAGNTGNTAAMTTRSTVMISPKALMKASFTIVFITVMIQLFGQSKYHVFDKFAIAPKPTYFVGAKSKYDPRNQS